LHSELELMEIHTKVLFNHNEAGKITYINEPPYNVAPRIYIGSTKQGNVIRYLNQLSEVAIKEFEQVINSDPSINLADIIQVISKDQPLSTVWIGPAFVFPNMSKKSSKVIKINQSNKDYLLPNFPYTYEELEIKGPCYAIIENNIAVSICCSARQTSKAAEASVYTLEDFRGNGYGVAVSHAWASDIQNQGRFALYSTSWDNYESQAMAQKLKLIQYGTDLHFS
jgi:GNAT acetyltransferase